MTTDKCFSCERKDVSPLCGICGVGMNGEREYYKRKPITNADRIRSLSDEELAEQLYLLRLDALRLEGFEGFIETKDEVLEWLKEEVKGESDED